MVWVFGYQDGRGVVRPFTRRFARLDGFEDGIPEGDDPEVPALLERQQETIGSPSWLPV
jgi:hypothetical protein